MKYCIRLLIIVFSFIILQKAQSQILTFGATVGCGFSKPPNAELNTFFKYPKLLWERNFRPAIFAQLPVSNHFFLQTEIAFVDIGNKADISKFKKGDWILGMVPRYEEYVIQFNELFGFTYLINEKSNISLHAMLGPYYAYGLQAIFYLSQDSICREDGVINFKKIVEKDQYDGFFYRSKIGLSGGIGIKKQSNIGTWIVDLRYEQCFSNNNVTKPFIDFSNQSRPRVMSVSVGYSFDIKRKGFLNR